MSRQIDFVSSNLQNFKKIIRPVVNASKSAPKVSAKQQSRNFSIQKSFIPEAKSSIHSSIAPELKELKDFYKKKIEHERKLKQLLAQGIIQKEDLQTTKVKKQQIQDNNKVLVDQSGQIRDQKGNLLFVKNRTASLTINKRIQENEKLKQMNKKQKIKFHQRLSKNLLDRNLVVAGNKKRIKRGRLGLQFLQKGSYQSVSALGPQIKKQQIQSISDIFKQIPDEQRRIIKKRNRTTLKYDRDVPQIEWWDKTLLNQATSYKHLLEQEHILLDNLDQEQMEKQISEFKVQDYFNILEFTDEVRHQRVGDQNVKDDNVLMPMYLTKDEKKKLKRKKKKQKLLEKNDMIKLGLIQPQKPKLKVANMAIVMGNEFVLDPSRVQQQAKRQQQQRLSKHLQQNSNRKLTKKQRKQKVIRKLKRDSAKQCRRIVFKIGKLDNTSQLFKVNMNAKQLSLNGFVIKPKDYHRQIVMVAAEGGAKAIKFYKNLLLNRIKWGEDEGNQCVLVWEGEVDNTTLGKWKVHDVGDQSETRKILREKGVEFFWDYVAN